MYNSDDFTKLASTAVDRAFTAAQEWGHTYVGSEHILLGIMHEGTAKAVMKSAGITEEHVSFRITELVGKGTFIKLADEALTPTAHRILDAAVTFAKASQSKKAGTEHILMAILHENGSSAMGIIKDLGGSVSKL